MYIYCREEVEKTNCLQSVDSTLNGYFSDGKHNWKCSITLIDSISIFAYGVTSRNFKLYEDVKLVPKYDGGICRFHIDPRIYTYIFMYMH